MFTLDVPTVFAFSMMLSVTLGGLLLWLWGRDREQTALASWGIGRLLGALALPMLAARGFIPEWVSIILANTFVCAGYGLTWAGARQFEGRRAWPAGVALGAVVWITACQVPMFFHSGIARISLIGVIVAAYNVAAAMEFHRGQKLSPLPSRPILVLLLLSVGGIYGICGPLAAIFPFKQNGVGLPASLWFGLLISLGLALVAATTILLVALTKERAEFRSTTILASARDIAAEASSQKTRFLARMSHELRTPLNGVLGLAQVLASDPEQGERQRHQAETLEQAGRHLLAILNEVLDLSRIEAGRLELSPRPVVLTDFLRETLALVNGSSMSNGVTLALAEPIDLPPTVSADPMRLRQILLNLLNNALKFTPRDGRVTLTVSRGPGTTLRFAVTDTGPGVPEALRRRLFEDFAQAEAQNASGGSGLGLAISARLALAMGGDLAHADGPDATGSTFTLTLPLPAVAAPVVPAAIQTSLPLGLRILVVDDVALNRMTARALLQHAGHVVHEAEDGPAALAAIASGPLPDIVLMDQSMPGMDGNTAARHIRSMAGPAGRLPIVAVTANALREDIDASLNAGMDGHVAKPIELKTLLTAIANALESAEARSRTASTPPARSGADAGTRTPIPWALTNPGIDGSSQ